MSPAELIYLSFAASLHPSSQGADEHGRHISSCKKEETEARASPVFRRTTVCAPLFEEISLFSPYGDPPPDSTPLGKLLLGLVQMAWSDFSLLFFCHCFFVLLCCFLKIGESHSDPACADPVQNFPNTPTAERVVLRSQADAVLGKRIAWTGVSVRFVRAKVTPRGVTKRQDTGPCTERTSRISSNSKLSGISRESSDSPSFSTR